jgi:DNA polymerase-4
MRGAGLAAGTVSLKLKYADFQIATRQEALPARTDDGEEIYRVAARLLAKAAPGRPIRLTGVSASDLGEHAPQLGLFDAKAARRARLNRSLDEIAGRFGAGAVLPADLLGLKK